MYLQLKTDDYQIIAKAIEEHKDSADPVRITVEKTGQFYEASVITGTEPISSSA